MHISGLQFPFTMREKHCRYPGEGLMPLIDAFDTAVYGIGTRREHRSSTQAPRKEGERNERVSQLISLLPSLLHAKGLLLPPRIMLRSL